MTSSVGRMFDINKKSKKSQDNIEIKLIIENNSKLREKQFIQLMGRRKEPKSKFIDNFVKNPDNHSRNNIHFIKNGSTNVTK